MIRIRVFSTTSYPAIAIVVFAAVLFQTVRSTADEQADGKPTTNEEPAAFEPQQGQLPVPPPDKAIVLFDGRGTNLFLSMAGEVINWPVKDGELISTPARGRTNHLVSKLHFRDAEIHVEFLLPDQGPGNSGVYLHGHYELQIYNSLGKAEPTMDDMGAIYGFSKPLANACRKPGEWQVYDIRYQAPRRDESGKIVQEGSLTAYLNGVKVQDHATFGEPRSKYHPFRYGSTPYLSKISERQTRTGVGPVFLQDHDAPVRFRNIWVRPLDDHAFLYEPEGEQDANSAAASSGSRLDSSMPAVMTGRHGGT